jgi:hypothetical protein
MSAGTLVRSRAGWNIQIFTGLENFHVLSFSRFYGSSFGMVEWQSTVERENELIIGQ